MVVIGGIQSNYKVVQTIIYYYSNILLISFSLFLSKYLKRVNKKIYIK
ncbi:hypothetical protein B0F89_1504 [Malaciobacter marinus]|uniref:Uncharacterized protein n=1 Tax=Malaciobacter marinus TaxID=505249 RepID=A0AB36ZU35_9BACT|nr:hypothetical protein B0F89_1504 [Malaciobacter marinus]